MCQIYFILFIYFAPSFIFKNKSCSSSHVTVTKINRLKKKGIKYPGVILRTSVTVHSQYITPSPQRTQMHSHTSLLDERVSSQDLYSCLFSGEVTPSLEPVKDPQSNVLRSIEGSKLWSSQEPRVISSRANP